MIPSHSLAPLLIIAAVGQAAVAPVTPPGTADPKPLKAVIQGPDRVEVGGDVILDAGASTGYEKLAWQVQGAEKPVSLEADADGSGAKVFILRDLQAGAYDIFLTASRQGETLLAHHKVVAGPSARAGHPAAASAPAPILKAKPFVHVGEPIVLDGTKSFSPRPMTWKVVGPKEYRLPPRISTPSGVEAGPEDSIAILDDALPGEYRVTLTARGPEGEERSETAVVQVGSPMVAAPPPAVPAAYDKYGHFHVHLIADPLGLPEAYRDAFCSQQLRQVASVPKYDFSYHPRDVNSSQIDALNLRGYLKGKTLPALVIQDSDGKVLWCETAPPEICRILEVVTSLR